MNFLARVGKASDPLKILRNCLTPQRFLWYLLCFGPLYILGGRIRTWLPLSWFSSRRQLNSVLRTKTHLLRFQNGKEYKRQELDRWLRGRQRLRINDIVLRVTRRSESKVLKVHANQNRAAEHCGQV